MAIGQPQARTGRLLGVRLYLALAFAAVAVITAGLSVLLVSDASEDSASDRGVDITLGRTIRLADRVGDRSPKAASTLLADVTDPGYSAWVFDENGELLTPEVA